MIEIDSGSIIHNSKVVGYYTYTNNTLSDIYIYENYRRRGFATKTIDKLVTKTQNKGYDIMRVISVISDSMTSILQDLGFERADKCANDIYNISIENIGNENTWMKTLSATEE